MLKVEESHLCKPETEEKPCLTCVRKHEKQKRKKIELPSVIQHQALLAETI